MKENIVKTGKVNMRNKTLTYIKEFFMIVGLSFVAALAIYCFVTPNNFAPGGVYGLGSMIQNMTHGVWGFENGIPWAIPVIIISIPIIILSIIILDKKSAYVITLTAVSANLCGLLLELIDFPQYLANGDKVLSLFAAAIGGIIAGVSYAYVIKFFGTSDGTIAIAAILKRKRPTLNIAWTTFAFDIIVVAASFFIYWDKYTSEVSGEVFGVKIVAASVPVVYSVVYMFFVSKFFDQLLKGFSAAYKFEVVCVNPEEISQKLMKELGRGVTVIEAKGMYTNTPKALLVCVVPKKQIINFKRILKEYPDAFCYVMPSNEVIGDFTM